MFRQIFTIARNTTTECIRQPVFVVLILVAALALVINPSLAAYTLDDDNKLLIDLGLSTIFMAGLLLAAFSATGVLASEIENRTVLTVVSKPVSRPVFIVGKYVGVAVALLIAGWTLSIVFLLTVRHKVMQTAGDPFDLPVIGFGLLSGVISLGGSALGNYFYRWVFTSSVVSGLLITLSISFGLVLVISKEWTFQSPLTDLDPQLCIALFLLMQAILIITAVAIAASTRLGQTMTLLICLGFFMFGLISSYLFSAQFLGPVADQSLIIRTLAAVAPNFQYLWQADALTQKHTITLQHVGLLTCYSLLYTSGILALAAGLFQTREVG